jgi:hypothetical protein
LFDNGSEGLEQSSGKPYRSNPRLRRRKVEGFGIHSNLELREKKAGPPLRLIGRYRAKSRFVGVLALPQLETCISNSQRRQAKTSRWSRAKPAKRPSCRRTPALAEMKSEFSTERPDQERGGSSLRLIAIGVFQPRESERAAIGIEEIEPPRA